MSVGARLNSTIPWWDCKPWTLQKSEAVGTKILNIFSLELFLHVKDPEEVSAL